MKSFLKKAKDKLDGGKSVAKGKLGIDVSAFTKKFFDAQDGMLSKDEFNLFWNAMEEDATDLNAYLQYLLLRLLHYLPSQKQIKGRYV